MSLVLADTSVWIDFLNTSGSEEAEKLAALLDEDKVCILPMIRAEVLSGARTEREFQDLKEKLSALPSLEEPEDLWDNAAWARFRLARRGIASSLLDIVIALNASRHHCPLLTRDKEFRQIAHVLPLRFA